MHVQKNYLQNKDLFRQSKFTISTRTFRKMHFRHKEKDCRKKLADLSREGAKISRTVSKQKLTHYNDI